MNDKIFHQNCLTDISFVVLHYLDFDVTKECVDNLLAHFPDSPIVVVDNGSPNQSGRSLVKQYKGYKNVHIILNSENVGFAQGNNIGCNFAKQFDTDFYVVLNNDVLVNGEGFAERINQIYNETGFSVLGPDIVTTGGWHQNPISNGSGLCNEAALESTIKLLKRKLNFYFILYLKSQIKRTIKNLAIKIFSEEAVHGRYVKEEKRIINPLLFGACYIFSKDYIDSHEFVFYPKTFMYFEEDILWYQCNNRHDTMVYDGSVSVVHKEGQSTISENKGRYKRGKNKLLRQLDSANVYLQLVKGQKNKFDGD